MQVSGSRSRHASGQTHWQRNDGTVNYRKAKQIQHKANATSTNKVSPQVKGTDGSKAVSQSKHKQEVPGKTEASKNTSKTTGLNTTNSEAGATGRVVTSGSVQTPTIRPKTEPVPVPPSPNTSS